MTFRPHRAMVARVVTVAMLVSVAAYGTAPAAYASEITANRPSVNVSTLHTGLASVDVTATATFNPKPGQAFARISVCPTIGFCNGKTGRVTGGGPTYTATADFIVTAG